MKGVGILNTCDRELELEGLLTSASRVHLQNPGRIRKVGRLQLCYGDQLHISSEEIQSKIE